MNRKTEEALRVEMGYRPLEDRRCDGCAFFRLVDGQLDRTWEGRCDFWILKGLGEMSVEEDALCAKWERRLKK